MQFFFNSIPTVPYSISRYPSWRYARDGLLRNLEKVKTYYRDRPMAVKSNHYLCRLLNSINIPTSLPIERYVDIADAKSWNISMAFKMNSPVYRGAIFKGGFYSSTDPEVYVSVSDYFDIYSAEQNWKSIAAVYPIHHNKTALDLLLPNGKDKEQSSGPTVIAINLPLLALQHRCFMLDQINIHGDDTSSYLTTSHFVHMYVLPNMLDKHLDIALFNRFKHLVLGAPMGVSTKTHPFTYPKYESHVDAVYNDVLQGLNNRTGFYKQELLAIPTAVAPDMLHVLKLPENAPTRQTVWVEVLARLDVLAVLSQLGQDKGMMANKGDINYFIRQFKHFRSDRVLETYLPADMYYDVVLTINMLERHWGSAFAQ